MIFSGRRTQGKAFAQVSAPMGSELVHLTTKNGKHIVALFEPALQDNGMRGKDPTHCITVLYFYGNGMCLNECLTQFDRLRRIGVNVLIPEYAGYGISDGSPSESNCYATADAVYDHLMARKDIDTHRIAAVGWSLGGAVAIDLASRRPVVGLATFSTFSTMTDEAHNQLPFLPTSLLLTNHLPSADKIAKVTCPIFMSHGTSDSIVPFRMMDLLCKAAGRPVTFIPVEGADHVDIFRIGGHPLFHSLSDFLQSSSVK